MAKTSWDQRRQPGRTRSQDARAKFGDRAQKLGVTWPWDSWEKRGATRQEGPGAGGHREARRGPGTGGRGLAERRSWNAGQMPDGGP
eukprot:3799468-Alexandrium_andersonii.AAC.1